MGGGGRSATANRKETYANPTRGLLGVQPSMAVCGGIPSRATLNTKNPRVFVQAARSGVDREVTRAQRTCVSSSLVALPPIRRELRSSVCTMLARRCDGARGAMGRGAKAKTLGERVLRFLDCWESGGRFHSRKNTIKAFYTHTPRPSRPPPRSPPSLPPPGQRVRHRERAYEVYEP